MRLWLPFPPSLNSLWVHGKGRAWRSETYERWIERATQAIAQQTIKRHTGPVRVLLRLSHSCRRARVFNGKPQHPDAFNYEKAICDFLTTVGAWNDDSQIMDGRIMWDTSLDSGVVVEITGLSYFSSLARLSRRK